VGVLCFNVSSSSSLSVFILDFLMQHIHLVLHVLKEKCKYAQNFESKDLGEYEGKKL